MKKGFTLAEVLLTLGIIGVVAAVTLPTLDISVKKQKVGPSLAKAINTLTNANRLALVQNDARSLTSLGCPDNYINVLSEYSKGVISGNNFKTTDGMEYIMIGSGNQPNVPAKYKGSYKMVDIDINGTNRQPNLAGEDKFRVYVDMNGDVIPYGGSQYKEYTGGGAVLWESQCKGDTIVDGYSCTGSIADNDWSVRYNISKVRSSQ